MFKKFLNLFIVPSHSTSPQPRTERPFTKTIAPEIENVLPWFYFLFLEATDLRLPQRSLRPGGNAIGVREETETRRMCMGYICYTVADQAKRILWIDFWPFLRISEAPKLHQAIRRHGSYPWGAHLSGKEQTEKHNCKLNDQYSSHTEVCPARCGNTKVTVRSAWKEIREIFTKETISFLRIRDALVVERSLNHKLDEFCPSCVNLGLSLDLSESQYTFYKTSVCLSSENQVFVQLPYNTHA